jgi:hypothetical protein
VAQVPLEVMLLQTAPVPIYQRIGLNAMHLNELGMTNSAIATRLGVNDKTVARAIKWIQKCDGATS